MVRFIILLAIALCLVSCKEERIEVIHKPTEVIDPVMLGNAVTLEKQYISKILFSKQEGESYVGREEMADVGIIKIWAEGFTRDQVNEKFDTSQMKIGHVCPPDVTAITIYSNAIEVNKDCVYAVGAGETTATVTVMLYKEEYYSFLDEFEKWNKEFTLTKDEDQTALGRTYHIKEYRR